MFLKITMAPVAFAAAEILMGGAGLAGRFSDSLVFSTENKFRTMVSENKFIDDAVFLPHPIAQHDAIGVDIYGSLQSVTLEVWVKPVPTNEQRQPTKGCCWPLFSTNFAGTAALGHLALKGTDAQSLSFASFHTDPHDPCNNDQGNRTPPGSFNIWDGGWHHVAATFNGTNFEQRLYLDGNLIYTQKCISALSVHGGGVFVGKTTDTNPTSWWEGDLDEIRLWNYARSQTDIRSTMKRVLTPSEVNYTVFYYNFDNFDDQNPYLLKDLSPNHLDLSLGQNLAMSAPEDRLKPEVIPSTAPIYGSTISLDIFRATSVFNGIYIINSVLDTAENEADQLLQITLTFPLNNLSSYGIDLLDATGNIVSKYPFVSNAAFTFSFRANAALPSYQNGKTVFNVSVSNSETQLGIVMFALNIQSAPEIFTGSAGSALYCDGSAYGYAKDFTFGQTNGANPYTVEYWAWFYYPNGPSEDPASAFSVGSFEIGANYSGNWCNGIKSPGIPNESFCKGRLLIDTPSSGFTLDGYSGWDPSTSSGLIVSPIQSRQGQWIHIAQTGDGKTETLYVNGDVVGKGQDFGLLGNPTGQPLGLYICIWPFWNMGHVYRGFMDEFRIWNVARTQEEIRETKHLGNLKSRDHPNMILAYSFDEYSSQISENSTGRLMSSMDGSASRYDLIYGGCVPNYPPYCHDIGGTCSGNTKPGVPCYSSSGTDILENWIPKQFLSTAPLVGSDESYLTLSNVNVTVKLNAMSTGSQKYTFHIHNVVDPFFGYLYDGSIEVAAGHQTNSTYLVFSPSQDVGGYLAASFSYSASTVYSADSQRVTAVISVKCSEGTMLFNSKCTPCPYGYYSLDASYDPSCSQYANLMPNNALGQILLIINVIGSILTLVITVLVCFYREKSVMKAASLGFSTFILLGCLLGHTAIFTFNVMPTSKFVCQFQSAAVALAFSTVMAFISFKTYRIDKIFNSTVTQQVTMKDNRMIKYPVLMALSLLCISVTGILIGVWYSTDSPIPMLVQWDADTLYYECASNSQQTHHMFSGLLVTYNAFLTLVCLLYALKIKNVVMPNFNESTYIAICIYNVSVVSIVLIPLIFLNNSLSYQIRQFFAGVIGVFLACGTASVLFLPKIVVAYQNIEMRSTIVGSNGDRSNIVSSNDQSHSKNEKESRKDGGQYFMIPNVYFKLKNQMKFEPMDLIILTKDRQLIARRCNQNVAQSYPLGIGSASIESSASPYKIRVETEDTIFRIQTTDLGTRKLLMDGFNAVGITIAS